MDLGLQGKRALVLGSSRGLGFAIARSLVTEGASVVICGRHEQSLDKAAAQLRALGGTVESAVVDLADRRGVQGAIDALARAKPQIEILVNNGGGPPPGSVADVSAEDWSRNFETMVNSIFLVTQHLLPGMRSRRWGRIINVASSGVVQPIPNLGISNALRSAIIGWAKTLAAEVAAEGVTVNSVLPGRILTERIEELDAAAARRTGKSVEVIAEESRKAIPVGRYGDPREFGDVVTFLASERASYITGSAIRVDGGLVRSI